ncbi:hypothetical protein [Mycobacterium sp. E740]|uniref:hypothetical protein n=1 Tax=Mycobacterium sp. E740 TaxID=1834149 RepID=UPI0008011C4D|nr:hypothetical protein [Mycobacterium sp. E740]OBI75139.1 hypothetical protein A5663_04700 [Mycobacterium sp. E740]
MSWLLVGLIPGLLMAATFGLQRLESALDPDAGSATDVAKFFQQAEPSDVNTLARDGMSRALAELRQRQLVDHAVAASAFGYRGAALPAQRLGGHMVNPEFRPTRHADRV